MGSPLLDTPLPGGVSIGVANYLAVAADAIQGSYIVPAYTASPREHNEALTHGVGKPTIWVAYHAVFPNDGPCRTESVFGGEGGQRLRRGITKSGLTPGAAFPS